MAQPEPAKPSPQEATEQLERHYARCFGSEDGKAVLADLMQVCFVHQSTYVPGCTDAMLINEGCRRVLLRIAAMTRMEMSEVYLQRARKPAGGA